MPIFEYQCSSCGLIFENFIISADKEAEQTCPQCDSRDTRRILSPFSAGSGHQAGGPGGGCGPVSPGFT
jgi:putative FmdB family regulatory protein